MMGLIHGLAIFFFFFRLLESRSIRTTGSRFEGKSYLLELKRKRSIRNLNNLFIAFRFLESPIS